MNPGLFGSTVSWKKKKIPPLRCPLPISLPTFETLRKVKRNERALEKQPHRGHMKELINKRGANSWSILWSYRHRTPTIGVCRVWLCLFKWREYQCCFLKFMLWTSHRRGVISLLRMKTDRDSEENSLVVILKTWSQMHLASYRKWS